jgi:hypothetical protein
MVPEIIRWHTSASLVEIGHKGFEDLDASMVCVPWFTPRSNMEVSSHGQGFSRQKHAKLKQLTSIVIIEIMRMNLKILEHGFCVGWSKFWSTK